MFLSCRSCHGFNPFGAYYSGTYPESSRLQWPSTPKGLTCSRQEYSLSHSHGVKSLLTRSYFLLDFQNAFYQYVYVGETG